MSSMRAVISGALVVAALFVVGVTAASAAAPGRSAAGSIGFADPAGDAGLAPDITTVAVGNDDRGLITFRVTVANRSALGPDDVIAIPLGTNDPNFQTGWRSDRVNFILGLDAQGAFLLEWNGVDMVEVQPPPGSVTGSFAGGVGTLTVKQEDLAPGFPDMSVPIEIQFYVLGIAFSGDTILAQDEAPDGADSAWMYRISQPLRVLLTNFDAGRTVKPGKTLIVLLGGAHADTGGSIRSGKIACSARLGSKALEGVGKFLTLTLTSPATGRPVESSSATCSFKVPKQGSKGKTIRGSMSVTEGGFKLSRSFTTRVR